MPVTKTHRIDWPAFALAAVIVVASSLPLLLWPERSAAFLEALYGTLANRFGIVYQLAGIAAIAFLAWLAASRHGRLRLGTVQDADFGELSWAGMLFCAGVGAGLLYWCAIEWAYYYQSPPFGVEAGSVAAAEWASAYGLFHWGFGAWAIYCLPAVAIAVPYYTRRLDFLRFSVCCHFFLDGREHGVLARSLDLLFMIALLGGAATSLGFSTPMIAAALGHSLGIGAGNSLELVVVGICILLFALSVWLGLERGIRRLSNINVGLAFALLLLILIVGPTTFLLKTSVNSVGMLADNFLRMSFWTDPFTESGFVESWTVFYWAWWVAFAPYVGLFVTRISRGRSLRQLIVGMLVWGSLGSWSFYMIMGNYGLFLEWTGQLDFVGIMNADGPSAALIAMLDSLPLSGLLIVVFAVIAIVFAATTYDSASFTLAASATLHLPAGRDPDRWHRVFWALALGLLPAALMLLGHETDLLRPIQVILLLVSLPLLGVGVVMCVALCRELARANTSGETAENL